MPGDPFTADMSFISTHESPPFDNGLGAAPIPMPVSGIKPSKICMDFHGVGLERT